MRRIGATLLLGAVIGATFSAFTAQAGSTRFKNYCNHAVQNTASDQARAAHGC